MINSRETDNLGKIFYIWGKNILLKKYNIPFEYNFYTHILNALIQKALRTPRVEPQNVPQHIDFEISVSSVECSLLIVDFSFSKKGCGMNILFPKTDASITLSGKTTQLHLIKKLL